MSTDLTEKLKELLMGCDYSGAFSLKVAKQLAPEIEKMMPRWIPVSERLPDEGQEVDLWVLDCRYENMTFKSEDNNRFFIEAGGLNMICLYGDDNIYWTPIPKGPTE